MKKKKINNIFYDIFDTIVSRNVHPEYVKKIWANNIVKIYELDITAIELYTLRSKVEQNLGIEALNSGFDCEIIYEDIIKKVYDLVSVDESFDAFLEMSINEEVLIESNVLYVNDDILQEIKKYKAEGSNIYCISDMYLTKNMIQSIFKNLKIDDYFNDIFVSSEYKFNKKSGKLYDVVLETLNLSPNDCLMIGDNKEKDYDIPREKGFNSIFVNREEKYNYYEKFSLENNPKSVIKELSSLSTVDNENFNNMIFSLYNFIDKLYFKLKKEKFKEVFFLSREGEYLKKLFDYYVESSFNEKIISHYLYVSRKSTYLPSLKKLNEENFDYLLKQYSYVTAREFLKSLNFSKEDIKSIEDDLKDIFDFDTKISWNKDSIYLKTLKRSKIFQDIYERNRFSQNELFKKYIKQHTDNKRLMIVDIGWNGSIQDNIQNILGDDYEVSGCYFGLCLRNKIYSGRKYGLIFSNDPIEDKQYRLYYENRTLYEIMCGASHGSANKYALNNNKVETLLFSKKEEQEIFNNVVNPAQIKMFDTFTKITNILCNKYYDNKEVEKIFNKIQFNLLYNPTKEQLEFFDKIYHYENFGVFEFTTFNNKNKIGFKRKLKEDAKFFIRRKTYFDDSFWPVLKLHNYKMKVPYLLYKNKRKRMYKRNKLF